MYGNERAGRYMIDSQFIYLSDVLLNKNDKLKYIYDFGDYFQHTITLTDIIDVNNDDDEKNCGGEDYGLVKILGGKRHGPIEDCGGSRAYVEKLNKMTHMCNTTRSKADFDDIANDFNGILGEIMRAINIEGKKFDSEECDLKKIQNLLYQSFQTELSSQSDENMAYSVSFGENGELVYGKAPKYALSTERQCHHSTCGKRSDDMEVCKRCLSAYYCNKTCQEKDFETNHKYYCFDHTDVLKAV